MTGSDVCLERKSRKFMCGKLWYGENGFYTLMDETVPFPWDLHTLSRVCRTMVDYSRSRLTASVDGDRSAESLGDKAASILFPDFPHAKAERKILPRTSTPGIMATAMSKSAKINVTAHRPLKNFLPAAHSHIFQTSNNTTTYHQRRWPQPFSKPASHTARAL